MDMSVFFSSQLSYMSLCFDQLVPVLYMCVSFIKFEYLPYKIISKMVAIRLKAILLWLVLLCKAHSCRVDSSHITFLLHIRGCTLLKRRRGMTTALSAHKETVDKIDLG